MLGVEFQAHEAEVFFGVVAFEGVEGFTDVVGGGFHEVVHDFLLLVGIEYLVEIVVDVDFRA